MCGYLDELRLFLYFVMVVHESLVCSEQLNFSFPASFVYFEPFPAVTVWFFIQTDCFPEDKLSKIYLNLQIQKVFTPPPSVEHQWIFWIFFNSCVWVPQLYSVWKDGSQNHTVTAGKGSNIQKMLENWRMCRSWRIFLKNSAQFNCSEQTRDSWTTITKYKNSRSSSR